MTNNVFQYKDFYGSVEYSADPAAGCQVDIFPNTCYQLIKMIK